MISMNPNHRRSTYLDEEHGYVVKFPTAPLLNRNCHKEFAAVSRKHGLLILKCRRDITISHGIGYLCGQLLLKQAGCRPAFILEFVWKMVKKCIMIYILSELSALCICVCLSDGKDGMFLKHGIHMIYS